MLVVMKSSLVELARSTVEPIRLASRIVPPEVRMMEIVSVVAVTLPTRPVLSWSGVGVENFRVPVMESSDPTLFENEELVRLSSCPRL